MSTTQRRSVHVNSLAAYDEGRLEMFSARELAILGALRRLKCATDRGVMIELGFTDPNSVRPRITGLIDRGVLSEVSNEQDAQTGKTVRVVAIVNRRPEQLRLENIA